MDLAIIGLGSAYEFEQITVSTSVVSLDPNKYSPGGRQPARVVVITCDTNGVTVRFDDNGVPPTAAIGHLMINGDTLTLSELDNIRNFRAIRSGGSDGFLEVTYLG
jgi:hypothetical protein